MATWKISNQHEKNVIEVQTFIKDGVKALKSQCYTWGTWTCQSDTMPTVDLKNQDSGSFDPGSSWQQLTVIDQIWTKWAFTVGTSDAEQQRIKSLWEANGDQGLINDGFAKTDTIHKIYGYLKLVNQDSGEQWFGSDLS